MSYQFQEYNQGTNKRIPSKEITLSLIREWGPHQFNVLLPVYNKKTHHFSENPLEGDHKDLTAKDEDKI